MIWSIFDWAAEARSRAASTPASTACERTSGWSPRLMRPAMRTPRRLPARSASDYKTAQHYLDILTGSFMIRSLPSWTENLGKRVRKAPKIYLRDSGLFHALQGIRSRAGAPGPPRAWRVVGRVGARTCAARPCRVDPGRGVPLGHSRGEPSWTLMLVRGGQRWGFEAQVCGRAAHDQVDARGTCRPETERLFVIVQARKTTCWMTASTCWRLGTWKASPERLAVSG